MQPRPHPEAIDTRLVFRIYAWVAITSGILVYCWPLVYSWPTFSLQVENRAQAIVLSLKRGLVSLEDLQQ